MKKIFFVALLSIAFCASSLLLRAQQVPSSTHIAKVVQVGQTVEFSLQAEQSFYVGGNIYILQIGTQAFDLSRQTDLDGSLVFLIPATTYQSLKEGEKIFISYGTVSSDESGQDALQDACATSPNRCKYLGLFSKKLLTK